MELPELQLNFAKYLLVLTIVLSLPSQADASGQDICDGWKAAFCAAMGGATMLMPTPASNKIGDAIEKADLPRLKTLLARHPKALTTTQLLSSSTYLYVVPFKPDPAADAQVGANRLEIIEYLLDTRTDIGHEALGHIVSGGLISARAARQDRLVAVFKLFATHGATFAHVDINDYDRGIKMPGELMAVMLENGADPNRLNRSGNPAVLGYLLNGRSDLAEVMLQHGANPNLARGPAEPSGLIYIARQCMPQPKPDGNPAAGEASSQVCEARSVAQIELLAKYGADLNGLVDTKSNCITPYLAAKAAHNQALADKLLKLGVDPNLCVANAAI